jgi:acyl-CoA reductase-like NAD-dependent aldehyde dehydrogenase
MVLKPSPFTPLACLRFGELARAALPGGVLNVLSGSDELGAAMVEHVVPRMVSFTGSVATGRRIASAAASDLKRVTLELGGNDPAIVLDDAEVESAADGIFAQCLFELRPSLRGHQTGVRARNYLLRWSRGSPKASA